MKFVVSLIFAATASLSLTAQANDEGTAAIETLGKLNGIALACQQPALVSRARNAVTTTAPKTRSNGEIFENATNASYLEQGKGRPCPELPQLVEQISQAEKRLQAAFPAAK